jgi:ketosteroid isomerase-like protein
VEGIGNIEVFRRAADAFDRRDRATWISYCDERFEVVPYSEFPEGEVVRGPEAGWEYYVALTEPFETRDYAGDADYEELSRSQILVHQQSAVRGRTSGADVDLDFWTVVTFREGKMLRAQWFLSRGEALAAADPPG